MIELDPNVISHAVTNIVPLAAILLLAQIDHTSIVSRDTWSTTHDYIVVGAGSAGSVVASRLSEDPKVTVLLIEAGGSESFINEIPIGAISIQGTPIDWKVSLITI